MWAKTDLITRIGQYITFWKGILSNTNVRHSSYTIISLAQNNLLSNAQYNEDSHNGIVNNIA